MIHIKRRHLFNFMFGLRGTFLVDEALSNHTSWRVGGRSEYFYTPHDKEDLIHLLSHLPKSIPIYWVGLGSNLLVRDRGVEGMIVKISHGISKIHYLSPDRIYAEAGVSCAKVARISVESGLKGVEFLAGIPGSFGGALAMNAGAFGGEVWDWVEKIEYVDREGNCSIINAESIRYGYRRVEIPENYCIVAGWLRLNPTGKNWNGKQKIIHFLKQRKLYQPVQSANAGSVFRNPNGDFAARLIEAAGLKGRREGNAQISTIHANFIVNEGGSTATDIENLIEISRKKIYLDFHTDLNTEVRIIGQP